MGNNSGSQSAASDPIRPPRPIGQIPLQLVHVEHNLVRNLPLAAPECCFEVFSPDLTQSCLFRAESRRQANIWFTSLTRQIEVLNQLLVSGRLAKTLPQLQVIICGLICQSNQWSAPAECLVYIALVNSVSKPSLFHLTLFNRDLNSQNSS